MQIVGFRQQALADIEGCFVSELCHPALSCNESPALQIMAFFRNVSYGLHPAGH